MRRAIGMTLCKSKKKTIVAMVAIVKYAPAWHGYPDIVSTVRSVLAAHFSDSLAPPLKIAILFLQLSG